MPFVTFQDDALGSLADHCIAAREIIGEHGSPEMRRLIDLLLFEVGVQIADEIGSHDSEIDPEGRA